MPRRVHHCHVFQCETPCPPRLLMCPFHWKMVPRHIQQWVYRTFQDGQTNWQKTGVLPSLEWHVAADSAIAAVAAKEGHNLGAAQALRRAERMNCYVTRKRLKDGEPDIPGVTFPLEFWLMRAPWMAA